MSLKSFIAKILAKQKAKYYQEISENALAIQQQVFTQLIQDAKDTQFGKDHSFESIKTYQDFQLNVPVRDYEQMKPYFDAIYEGKADILWKGKPLYLAKTSGTTSGAKYIPITKESIPYQIAGAKDTLLLYIHHKGKAGFLSGKMMFLSGSPILDTNKYGVKVGRLSGIVNHFVPAYLQTNRVPSYETNCIEEWEMKVQYIVKETKNKDLRLISGIPPWVQMFFEETQKETGKMPLEVWKNLQVFVQGGVDFSAYKPVFDKYFGDKVDIVELFPASEGFFAFQDDYKDPGLLLILNGGIFYEFIPMQEYGNPDAKRLTLAEVELNTQYAMIISTNAGLWAYDLGDTIKFVSLNPYKIRVTGRVKHFLSAFGEHVIVEEVNKAILKASEANQATFQEFTVAPFVSPIKGESYHEWFIEFTQAPIDMHEFIEDLDLFLRNQNTYYNDLREGNMLKLPVIHSLPLNASREYMRSEGKLGGQNKFPRLSNNRKIADFFKQYI